MVRSAEEIFEEAGYSFDNEGWNGEGPTLCVYVENTVDGLYCKLLDKKCDRNMKCIYRSPWRTEELDDRD